MLEQHLSTGGHAAAANVTEAENEAGTVNRAGRRRMKTKTKKKEGEWRAPR